MMMKSTVKNSKKSELSVILVDVRSAHNVGSVFRTADAAGVSKIFLTGYTPAPRDKFGRERGDISKVALGAEKTVPWEHVENTQALLKKFRKLGVQIVAVEQDKESVDYKKFKSLEPEKFSKPTALIFGNETKGLPKNLLKLCDKIIEIPMRGTKESLNVSVSAGIILFELAGE